MDDGTPPVPVEGEFRGCRQLENLMLAEEDPA
jgi:hypothetical protein